MARTAACLLLCMMALAVVATHAELLAEEVPGRDLKSINKDKDSHKDEKKKWVPEHKKGHEPEKEHKPKEKHHKKKKEHKKKCKDVCYRYNEHHALLVCSCSEHHDHKKQECH